MTNKILCLFSWLMVWWLSPPGWAATKNVSMENFFFSPDTVRVQAGDQVRWINNAISYHTTTSFTGEWNSGLMEPGQNFLFRFTTVDTIDYRCTLHCCFITQMRGVVIVIDTDKAPVITPIPPQSIDEGQLLRFVVIATDSNGGQIPALTAADLPANATFHDSLNGRGLFSFLPDFNQAGLYNATFIASDGFKADTEQVPITVNNINRAPVLTDPGAQVVAEGQTLQLVVISTDPDGQIPVLSAIDLPANATFDDSGNGHGLFSFSPDFFQAGMYTVTFIASDGSLTDSQTVSITVSNVNRGPILNNIGPQVLFENDTLALSVSASDPDLTIPALLVENLPVSATFVDSGNGHGLFTFEPDSTQIGKHDVTFIASDGALADSEIVTVSVCAVSGTAAKGDVNCDGVADIIDIVYLINNVFFDGPPPLRFESGDLDCNTVIDLIDIVILIQNAFFGEPIPC